MKIHLHYCIVSLLPLLAKVPTIWKCETCTLDNPVNAPTCEACGSKNSHAKKSELSDRELALKIAADERNEEEERQAALRYQQYGSEDEYDGDDGDEQQVRQT